MIEFPCASRLLHGSNPKRLGSRSSHWHTRKLSDHIYHPENSLHLTCSCAVVKAEPVNDQPLWKYQYTASPGFPNMEVRTPYPRPQYHHLISYSVTLFRAKSRLNDQSPYRSPVFVNPVCQNAKITRSNVRIELPYTGPHRRSLVECYCAVWCAISVVK